MDNATSPELTSPVWRIAAYDFDAGGDFVALEVGSADELPLEADLSGDGVLVIFNSRVALYAIDGSNERTLYRAPDLGYITGGAASPDGLLVALSVQREDPCLTAYAAQGGSCRPFTDFMFVTVLDRDGNELLNIEQADPRFDDFHGYFAPIVWRNDGEGFMVHGYTGSEAPGGNATILLDGDVVVSSFRTTASTLHRTADISLPMIGSAATSR